MKKFLNVIITVMVFLSVGRMPVNAEEDISVFLDGQKISFNVALQIINDYTMVPMRVIFEALGHVDKMKTSKYVLKLNHIYTEMVLRYNEIMSRSTD